MNGIMMNFLSGVVGLLIGIIIMIVISKMGLNKSKHEAELLLKEAENKADTIVKQAVLDGRTQTHELKINAEKEIKKQKD